MDGIPTNIGDCFDSNGEFDPAKYFLLMSVYDEDDDDEEGEAILRAHRERREARQREHLQVTAVKVRTRRFKKKKRYTTLLSGEVVEVTADMANWNVLYLRNPDKESDEFSDEFRSMFRLPYASFLELVDMVRSNEAFAQYTRPNCSLDPPSSIELLVLGALRVLGRGWTFKCCWESTLIHHTTHRHFFHQFIAFGREVLYPMYVKFPTTPSEAYSHMFDYHKVGFNGAIGSTDGTHIASEKIPFSLQQHHDGHKLPIPSRTYNLTCDHRRRILHSTQGHPARWNDQTLVLFDRLVTGIHDGELLDDVSFKLYYQENNEVKTQEYLGVWLLVDNGYLAWSCTIPPLKNAVSVSEMKWSKMLESARKDVECTFGILKGRFRIFKAPLRVHGTDAVDNIWCTCCALHNMLLDVDGLPKDWVPGTPTAWEGELGQFNANDVDIPQAVVNALGDGAIATFDLSGIGPGNDDEADDVPVGGFDNFESRQPVDVHNMDMEEGDRPTLNGGPPIRVRHLTRRLFRDRLVEHFTIAQARGEVEW